MDFEKISSDHIDNNNNNTIKLQNGTLEEISYDYDKFKFTNRSVLIGLHNNDPEFNQTVFFIQNIRKNNGSMNSDVINEYIKENPDKLIFIDPISIIPSSRIISIANDQNKLLEVIKNTREMLFECNFVEVCFNRKFYSLLSDIFIYPNKIGEEFIKKYSQENILIDSVIRQ